MYKFIFWFSDVLCVTGVWSQIVFGVSYTSTEICALRGSTVDMTSTYRYPSRWNDLDTTVQKTFWFIKESNGIHVDLSTDPEYSGRVENLCGNNTCTLRISNLTESDSAVYKFRFTTNRGGISSGSAGVTLNVTGNIYIRVSLKCSCVCWNQITVCSQPLSSRYKWGDQQPIHILPGQSWPVTAGVRSLILFPTFGTITRNLLDGKNTFTSDTLILKTAITVL